MKQEELNQCSEQELEAKLQEDLEELENLRFQKALQELENPLRLRLVRREIAQIRTVLREYEIGIRQTKAGE